jgi:hypothetical protein
METKGIVSWIVNGSTTHLDREDATGEIPWIEHPRFKGVFLKHIIKGVDTNGMLSCHMVRIDANAVLEDHIHDNQWELHEVIEGDGKFVLNSKETAYHPGRIWQPHIRAILAEKRIRDGSGKTMPLFGGR